MLDRWEWKRYVQEEDKLPRVVITSAKIALRTMVEEFVKLPSDHMFNIRQLHLFFS